MLIFQCVPKKVLPPDQHISDGIGKSDPIFIYFGVEKIYVPAKPSGGASPGVLCFSLMRNLPCLSLMGKSPCVKNSTSWQSRAACRKQHG